MECSSGVVSRFGDFPDILNIDAVNGTFGNLGLECAQGLGQSQVRAAVWFSTSPLTDGAFTAFFTVPLSR